MKKTPKPADYRKSHRAADDAFGAFKRHGPIMTPACRLVDNPPISAKSPPMNLRWMMLFATIAEEGSFTRAATRLNIAQPWLSAQIRKLEYELGVQLLVRQSAGVQVTPEGEALLPYAHQLAEAARMFRQVARTLGDAQSKTVRIGSHVPMLDIAALRAVNREFARNYANFGLTAAVAGVPALLDRLAEAEFDLAVALSPLPHTRDPLETLELGPLRPYLLAPAALSLKSPLHLAGRTVHVPPASWHPSALDTLLQPLLAAGAAIRPVAEFDHRAMAHSVRAHGLLVLMVDDARDDFAADNQLAVLPLPDTGAQHLLVRARGRELSRSAERYWALAKSRTTNKPSH
jgi:DNA-binding transcriptional LysR family regulator